MKKYVFFIVSIGVILAGLLFYNVYNIQKENMKNFEEPGYIYTFPFKIGRAHV